MDKYIVYNNTEQFYRELMNIVLISIEETGDCYCYCSEEIGGCGICELATFLVDPHEENKIEGISPRKFITKYRDNKEKLQIFADKIVFFFDRIREERPDSLDFFKKEYSWSLKVYSTGESLYVDLDQSIENEILRYENDDADEFGIYS